MPGWPDVCLLTSEVKKEPERAETESKPEQRRKEGQTGGVDDVFRVPMPMKG